MTPSERLAMYRQYPGALVEEVSFVFQPLANDQDRVKHNIALGHFAGLFGNDKSEAQLWSSVAQAIIQTAERELSKGQRP
jgi:hypothetical protein